MIIDTNSQVQPVINRTGPETVKKLAVVSSTPTTAPVQDSRQNDVTVGKNVPQEENKKASRQAREEVVTQAVASINDYVQTVNRALEFTQDDELGQTIIKVIDRETDKVIRQIPSKEVIAIARAIKNQQEVLGGGLLIQDKA